MPVLAASDLLLTTPCRSVIILEVDTTENQRFSYIKTLDAVGDVKLNPMKMIIIFQQFERRLP